METKERCFICNKVIYENETVKVEDGHVLCSTGCQKVYHSKRQEIVYEDPQFGFGY